MALMHTLFTSSSLKRRSAMNVFVPEKPHSDGKPGFPVIYLLHGRSDDENSYADHGIRALAEKYEFIVVMPDGGRSFYTNLASGENYWDLISLELPRLIATMFPARTDRASTFAAGLSMGGYGALKLGLRQPERFACIGAMSAVADIAWVGRKEGCMCDAEVNNMFGSRTGMTGTENDLFELLKTPAPACGFPELVLRCGDSDMLIEDNREFVRKLQNTNIKFDYAETPGAGHEWPYWMAKLDEIFACFSR